MKDTQQKELYFRPLPIIGLTFLSLFMFIPIVSLFKDLNDTKVLVMLLIFIPITVWFSYRVTRFLIYLIQNRPALILTETHLLDNFAHRQISWVDIHEIRDGDLKSRYLSIVLNNPEKYIGEIKSSVSRKLYRYNTKLFNATFTIPFDILKGDKEENLSKALVEKINYL
jgi:hypothetical protein